MTSMRQINGEKEADASESEFAPEGQDAKLSETQWLPGYWVLAGLIPFVFYAFDAAMRTSYPETQAPNVSLLVQLSVMFGFYGLWVFVPRLIWQSVAMSIRSYGRDIKKAVAQLLILGVILCAAHLLFLTLILRTIYSPPGWGIRELIYSYGEVCLGNAAIWLMAYGVVAAVILYRLNAPDEPVPQQSRYEVRQNGKIWSIQFDDIFWIKAAGNYAELHTNRGTMLVRKTLTLVSNEVADGNFIRSHRSALINGKHVVAIKSQSDASGYIVELSSGDAAPLSRRYHAEFRQALLSVD